MKTLKYLNPVRMGYAEDYKFQLKVVESAKSISNILPSVEKHQLAVEDYKNTFRSSKTNELTAKVKMLELLVVGLWLTIKLAAKTAVNFTDSLAKSTGMFVVSLFKKLGNPRAGRIEDRFGRYKLLQESLEKLGSDALKAARIEGLLDEYKATLAHLFVAQEERAQIKTTYIIGDGIEKRALMDDAYNKLVDAVNTTIAYNELNGIDTPKELINFVEIVNVYIQEVIVSMAIQKAARLAAKQCNTEQPSSQTDSEVENQVVSNEDNQTLNAEVYQVN